WPQTDGEVTDFFRWLAHTHAMRWRVAHRTVGYGHLYQGRFKSFPVQSDEHVLTVLRYVERNALGAGLVERAEQWRWGGLWARVHGDDAVKAILWPWPVEPPKDWLRRVNTPLSAKELRRLSISIARGQPYGEEEWVKRTAKELSLEHTIRPEGRPPKRSDPGGGANNEVRPCFWSVSRLVLFLHQVVAQSTRCVPASGPSYLLRFDLIYNFNDDLYIVRLC